MCLSLSLSLSLCVSLLGFPTRRFFNISECCVLFRIDGLHLQQWSDVVKGLEDELETVDSVEKSDLDEVDLLEAKRTRRQSKPTPIRRSRRVEGRQYRKIKGAYKGLGHIQTNRVGSGTQIRTGRGALN